MWCCVLDHLIVYLEKQKCSACNTILSVMSLQPKKLLTYEVLEACTDTDLFYSGTMMFSKLLGRWPADAAQSYVPYEHYYTPACPHCPVSRILP